MAPRKNKPSRKLSSLEDIYAEIDRLAGRFECKGRCAGSCGVIALYRVEAASLAGKGIPAIECCYHPVQGEHTCTKLDNQGRCTIYSDRPFICRLWGLVPEMRCPFGCVPQNWISRADQQRLQIALIRLSKSTKLVVAAERPAPAIVAPHLSEASDFVKAMRSLHK